MLHTNYQSSRSFCFRHEFLLTFFLSVAMATRLLHRIHFIEQLWKRTTQRSFLMFSQNPNSHLRAMSFKVKVDDRHPGNGLQAITIAHQENIVLRCAKNLTFHCCPYCGWFVCRSVSFPDPSHPWHSLDSPSLPSSNQSHFVDLQDAQDIFTYMYMYPFPQKIITNLQ